MVIYTTAFNIIKNSFDYVESIESFCNFADNVVVAVNTSKDNTLQALTDLTVRFNNLKVFPVEIDYSDPLLDGKIKHLALKLAEESFDDKYFIGIDLDEELILSNKNAWQEFADLFIGYYRYDALLIPSINLWGDRDTVRWDEQNNKAYKWYLHRRGLSRGPVKGGFIDGFLLIDKSDGCEVNDESGNLANSIRIDQELDFISDCSEYYKNIKIKYPYVLHKGYVDFEQRLKKVNNFWKKQWNQCSNGKNVNIIEDLEEFKLFKTEKHNLYV